MIRTVLILALAITLAGESASAQSDGLRRLTDREDLLGWEAVGRLDMNAGGFCTATLIASDLVLTAAHCVYAAGQPRDVSELTFRAGLRDGVSVAERRIVSSAVSEAYDPAMGMRLDNVSQDVALLKLERPITVADANPFVLFQGDLRGPELSVASYGEGRAEALSRQRTCQVVTVQDPIIAFDCDVTFGSSGAPVFAKNGNRGRIVSIVSGSGTVAGARVALGMRLPTVVAQLKAQLRRQPVARAKPSIRRLGADERKTPGGAKFVRTTKP